MNKYSFSREDFLMHENFFLKELDKKDLKAENRSVNQKHDKSFKNIVINMKYQYFLIHKKL